MTRVVLGNRHAIVRNAGEDGAPDQVTPGPKGKQATVIDFPEGTSLSEAFVAVTSPQGVWAYHAAEGKAPAWVASDSPGLAALLSEHFGGAEVRDLEDPYQGRFGPVAAAAATKATLMLARVAPTHVLLGLLLGLAALASPALKTNAGNDFQANQMGGTPSATAVAKYVGITANTTAPAATDTALTGEIATAGGGLIRKAGTYAHTTGAASYTITTVFTANATDVLPVTIGKRGIFDAVTAGNMVFETLVSPTATLSASGDQLTLTDTINL